MLKNNSAKLFAELVAIVEIQKMSNYLFVEASDLLKIYFEYAPALVNRKCPT
jgi:hypothetical protein